MVNVCAPTFQREDFGVFTALCSYAVQYISLGLKLLVTLLRAIIRRKSIIYLLIHSVSQRLFTKMTEVCGYFRITNKQTYSAATTCHKNMPSMPLALYRASSRSFWKDNSSTTARFFVVTRFTTEANALIRVHLRHDWRMIVLVRFLIALAFSSKGNY